MFQTLTIRNLVLIEELSIQLYPGMQVLTGETGAGKSIIVDAVNLVLGGRADRSLIRTGCDKASVEAVFDVPGNSGIAELLRREQIEYDGRTVTVYRELSVSGKSICRICGMISTVSFLREVSFCLVNIYGQHEHRFLMEPELHRNFLDRMGEGGYRSQLDRTALAYDAFINMHRRYARLRKENERKQQRIEELEKDLHELHEAKLRAGEEENLVQENLRLRNAEKILSLLHSAREYISFAGNGESALEKIKAAASALESVSVYSSGIKEISGRCESLYYELEEISYELGRLAEENEFDPRRLEETENRMDLIHRLKRKYGGSVKEVLNTQQSMEKEYDTLCSLEDELNAAGLEHKQLLLEYRREARVLSVMRRQLAETLEEKMEEQLKDLGMIQAVFRVRFEQDPSDRRPFPDAGGDDRIEFTISTNPGQPLMPLAQIASGGELSRLMLALKTIETEDHDADCLIFDEIDTGISGKMAQAVSEKMVEISRKKQVICVTHLAQIAAAADHQFAVSKTTDGKSTSTSVRETDREGRILEIARMVGGAEGSGPEALQYARSMIEAAEKMKS